MANDVRANRAGTAGVLRGERATSEAPDQEVRLSGGRGSHVGRGSYINYYDDLGISTTSSNAGEIRKQESEFQRNVAEQQGKISGAKNQLESQYAKGSKSLAEIQSGIPSPTGAIAEAWNQTKASFLPVRVVSGANNVEGTYYLPKEAANNLVSSKGLHANWADGGKFLNVDVKAKGGGKNVSKELHEAFQQAEKDIYNQWYINSAGTLTKGVLQGQAGFERQRQAAYKNLNEQYTSESGKIAEAQGVIDSATMKRAAEWEQLRDDYAQKRANIAEIFKDFQVEAA